MSLRMNLYGCDLQSVTASFGSQDEGLLKRAIDNLAQILQPGDDLNKAICWLQTIIKTNVPLRVNRPAPFVSEDGGLLVCQLEAEIHVLALHCLVTAVRREEHLNLTEESSFWNHVAVTELQMELSSCRFEPSDVPLSQLLNYFAILIKGTPFFGDDFRSSWSIYSFLPHSELSHLTTALQDALTYERMLPEKMPEEIRQQYTTKLSDGMNTFVSEFIGWLKQLDRSGQDMYLIWS